ncbi:MAG: ferritin [Acidimicrobiia bacterium]|nr:ferritin [Acidimicrobiia bacterium]MDX2468298.1 ferritin [Acidimicrobiia bacterium]
MALNPELEKTFNDQVNLELTSAHQYLALSAWLETEGLPGMAHWMKMQAGEENEHAMKFYQFLLDRNARVALESLPKPQSDFASVTDVFRAALAAEETVTAAINTLYTKAVEAKDFASYPLLDWFVNEQVEEEATVQQIIDDLERTEGSGHALLMLDRELGARVSGAE